MDTCGANLRTKYPQQYLSMIAVKLFFIVLLSFCFFKYFGKSLIIFIIFLWKFWIALMIIGTIIYLIPDTETQRFDYIENTSLLA
jgi:hypothetical protein